MVNIVFEGTKKEAMESLHEAICDALFTAEDAPVALHVSKVGEIEGEEGYFNFALCLFESDKADDLWMVLDFDKAFKKRDEVLTPELSRGIFSEGSVCC